MSEVWGSVGIAVCDGSSQAFVRDLLGPGRTEGVSALLLEVDLPERSVFESCRGLQNEGRVLSTFRSETQGEKGEGV